MRSIANGEGNFLYPSISVCQRPFHLLQPRPQGGDHRQVAITWDAIVGLIVRAPLVVRQHV
jgi:hypothetical protein